MSADDTEGAPAIHIVLDSSALLAYARVTLESIAIGELLSVVIENGARAGAGMVSYLDAFHRCAEEDRFRLRELADDVSGVLRLLPLHAGQAGAIRELAVSMETGQAQAVFEARRHSACLATLDGTDAKPYLPEHDVLELE